MGHAITVKGQVTIPKRLRDHLGLRPGDEVEFAVEQDGRVVLRRAAAQEKDFARRIASIRGSASNPETRNLRTEEILHLLRSDES